MINNRRFASSLALAIAFALFAPLPRCSAVIASAVVASASDAATPPHSSFDQGAVGLAQAIKRLGVVASALHTGAHPDDEDSALLAYLARGRQARTAYLSLTRGDGGQNLIGPELYDALGVIRTDELLAARKLDGALQFFTRAYDFGFSKSREEALSKWDREAVLADMVRVIRTFRPLVIVSQWSGTPADGHGHHQAAGLLTAEAHRAAGDPKRFPEQIAEGLKPWKAPKLYVKVFERRQRQPEKEREPVSVSLNTGQYDPLFGRSYYEIAMQGRSQHRSQDQGAIERRGPQYSRMRLLESAVGPTGEEKDIFEGLDTSVLGLAQFAGGAASRLKAELSEVQDAAVEAARNYNPLSTSDLSRIISRGLRKLRQVRATLGGLGMSESELYETDFLFVQKERDFVDALAKTEGVVIDCLSDDELLTPGQTFNLTVAVYSNPAARLSSLALALPEGWSSSREKEGSAVSEGRLISQAEFKITVSSDPEVTGPYWLKQPRNGEMFNPGKGGTGIEPHALPPVVARVEFEIDGQKIVASEPARFRYADKALGEMRREINVAPALSLAVQPGLLIGPASSGAISREVSVSLVNNSKTGSSGRLSLTLPDGWRSSPGHYGFELKREGERASYTFNITIPPGAAEGRYNLQAVAISEGKEYSRGYQEISYPHTESRLVYYDAKAVASVFDVKVAPGLLVGYIEGAGDDFANALKRLGVDVKVIEPRELASGDLGRFNVIVTGIRVYETRPDVIANNTRLLDYVKQGGTLIVQYNKNEIASGNFAPFPVKMKQTPDRVTDERARVSLLDPSHPVFNYPNKITEQDFLGWVQERGTYFFSEWDTRYRPLMASNDPGEESRLGGQLIAQYGKGYYIYTGYAWFRQLPAGVPGAYRLVANLVSFAKAKPGSRQPSR